MRWTVHNPPMPLLRAILAVAIAAWLGFLPTLGAIAAFSEPSDVTTIHDDAGMPCHHSTDVGKTLAACALKCFQVCADELVAPLILPPPPADLERSFIVEAFHSRPPVPPFRPPAA
jgi:hypothetical protein